jgi:hypothetical protein
MIGVSVSGGIRDRTASETLHFADDVLVGSMVRYLSNFSAARHFGEHRNRRKRVIRQLRSPRR